MRRAHATMMSVLYCESVSLSALQRKTTVACRNSSILPDI